MDIQFTMRDLDGVELELTCLCGVEAFDRIVVERRQGNYVTDFVCCVGCRTVFYVPQRPVDQEPQSVGSGMRGIGGPAQDSTEALKRDASDAARDYVKPGRTRR